MIKRIFSVILIITLSLTSFIPISAKTSISSENEFKKLLKNLNTIKIMQMKLFNMMFYVKLRQMKVQDLPLSIISKLKKMNMYETWFLLEMKMVNSSKFY